MKGEESSAISFIGSCFFLLCLFPLQRTFYIFLCFYQLLHFFFVPCGSPGSVLSFLSAVGIFRIQLFDLGSFFKLASSKAAFAALCSVISSRWASRNFLLYPALR